MLKPKKNKKLFKDFTVELGDSISLPLDAIPEYPNKVPIPHNEAVYYFYRLDEKLVLERFIVDDQFLPMKAYEK